MIQEIKYSVGDIVTIREWDDMAAEFGIDSHGNIDIPFMFTSAMKSLCGTQVTIQICERAGIVEDVLYKYYVDQDICVYNYLMFKETYGEDGFSDFDINEDLSGLFTGVDYIKMLFSE